MLIKFSLNGDPVEVHLKSVFGFIDVVLDHPLRVGGTGWDKIRQMARK